MMKAARSGDWAKNDWPLSDPAQMFRVQVAETLDTLSDDQTK
jgi:hypothetical protein